MIMPVHKKKDRKKKDKRSKGKKESSMLFAPMILDDSIDRMDTKDDDGVKKKKDFMSHMPVNIKSNKKAF